MITVEQAKQILLENVNEITEHVTIKVTDALGYKLAEDIYATLDLPPFNQSNVDGYAINFLDSKEHSWKVIAEIKAGDEAKVEVNAGEATRIFTGAMVPENTTAIIMQEKITRSKDDINFVGAELIRGEHIRKKGSQIKSGELAVPKGVIINPAVIGFISSLGLSEIEVYRKPKVTLVITGNELQPAGSDLLAGRVYESNSSSLSAALTSMGLTIEQTLFVKDDKQRLSDTIMIALKNSDLILVSGGISVGDYDFVNEVLDENNTHSLFYKIAQKPGKPLFFGKNKHCFIFGLPGNPASALTCFYEYVYPCLKLMQGRVNCFLTKLELTSETDIPKKKGLANFLKAHVNGSSVLALDGQESFKTRSFTETNAFIYLPLEKENIKAGELVEVHLLPSN